MSNPESHGQDDLADQHPAADSHLYYDSSQAGQEIDPSLVGAGSNDSSSNLLPGHSSENMAQHPVGGYANNETSGYMGNVQSSFVPRTPGPPMKRQLASNGNTSFTSPQGLNYNSSVISSSGNGPFTPSQHLKHDVPNHKNNGSSSLRPQQPNSFTHNMAQLHFAPTMGHGKSAYNNADGHSMLDLQDINDMAFENHQNTNGPRGMLNTTNMSLASIPRNYQGEPHFPVQTQSYRSSGDSLGLGAGFEDFTFNPRGEYGVGELQGRDQLSGRRSNPSQAFRNEQMMKRENSFGLDAGEQAFDMSNWNQNDLARRAELHPMHPDYGVDYEEENDGENGDISYQDEESGDDARIGRASNSRFASSNSSSGPKYNIPKFKPTIMTEAEFTKLVADRDNNVEKILNKMSRKKAYPHTDEENLECIGSLYNAIMNTEGIVDKPAQDGRKAQAARRLDDDFYPSTEVEFACWEVLRKCKQASRGVTLVQAHHGAKHEGKVDHPTFKSRWTAIIEACQSSKAVCKQVLDPSYVDRLVDAPHAQFKMKLNNKKINAERDKQNKLGRLAINAGVSSGDLPVVVKQEDDEQMVVTPSKRSASGQRQSATKRRTPNVVKYEHDNEDDEEGDDDDEEKVDPAFETPVKTKQSHSMSVSSRLIRTPHKRTPVKAASSSSAKAKKPSPFPQPTAELNHQYRLAICDFIQVSPDNADKYTLDELRFFARAYNSLRKDEPWYHESFTNGEYLSGHRMYFDKGTKWAHFACSHPALSMFCSLAIQRGELHENSTVNREHRIVYYDPTKSLQLKQVLGIAPNAFGMKSYTHPPPQVAPQEV
ncbi:hypothetical protein DL95DRAFT_456643 [Leptodontidium sp. 2 PMI_412]|nr:hypothetical protein DL95DRAFT_456643 [Leptodontidium sp. 2 PMI_412]